MKRKEIPRMSSVVEKITLEPLVGMSWFLVACWNMWCAPCILLLRSKQCVVLRVRHFDYGRAKRCIKISLIVGTHELLAPVFFFIRFKIHEGSISSRLWFMVEYCSTNSWASIEDYIEHRQNHSSVFVSNGFFLGVLCLYTLYLPSNREALHVFLKIWIANCCNLGH